MPAPIALVGGDEFREDCRLMDKVLLAACASEPPRILIIPTAAVVEGAPQLAAQHGVDYFNSLGANAFPLMVIDRKDANNESLVASLEDTDIVYFTGGSPSYLLDTLKGSLLWKKVLEANANGCLLAGSSAGAMVLGSRMKAPSASWEEGLGVLLGLAVLPHHETAHHNEVHNDLASRLPNGLCVLGIDAATACTGGSKGWRVVGKGKVTLYTREGWRTFRPDSILPLTPWEPGAPVGLVNSQGL